MSARTPENLHGFLMLDDAFTDANRGAGTTATQGDPSPDMPQPDGNSGYLELRQVGDALTNTEYRALAVSSGGASNTGAGGAYAWRPTTSTDDTDYRGWVAWRHLMDMYRPGIGSAKDLSAVRMSDGTVIIACTSSSNPTVLHRAPDASSWSAVTVDSSVTVTGGVSPTALVRVPRDGGERALLFQVQRRGLHPSPADVYSIHAYASDDGGATWSQVVYGGQGFTVPSTSTPRLMTAAYHDGYLTVLVENLDGGTTTWYHLVSSDMGASWVEVENYNSGGALATHDPQAFTTPLGQVCIVYRVPTNTIRVVIKSTPYQPITGNPTLGTVTQLGNRSAYTYSIHWATIGTDGRVYIQARETGANADNIDMWVINPDQPSTVYDEDARYYLRGALRTGDITECLGEPGSGTNISPPICVEYRDQLLYAGPVVTNAGTYGTSLWFAHFGGYSSIDWRDAGADFDAASTRAEHGGVYIPVDIPTNWGTATMTTSGSFTEEIGTDGLLHINLPSGGGLNRYNADMAMMTGSPTPGVLNGFALFSNVDVSASSATATGDTMLEAHFMQAGPKRVSIAVGLLDTTAELYDIDGAATSLGSASGLTAGAKDYLLVSSFDGGSTADVGLFWRENGGTLWTKVATASITPGTTGGTAKLAIEMDNYDGSSYFENDLKVGIMSMMSVQDGGVVQWPISHPAAWPESLSGRPFPMTPHDLAAGRQVYAAGGPAYFGDAWTVGTRYARGLHQLDPTISPSPAVYWESTDTTEQILEWDLTTADRPLDGTIGIYLGGCNFRTAYLEEWNGAAWVATATIDLATGTNGLSYTLDGKVLTAAGTGTAATRYIHMDELADCTVVLDTGGTATAKRVSKNSEGVWDPGHSRKPLVRLDSTHGVTSGTCDLCASSVVVLVHDRTTARTKYRLRIPASQAVPDPGYRVGTCLIGPMVYIPQVYDWGRQMEARPNVDVTEGRDGRRFATRRGAPRRSVEVSWPGGTDTTHVYDLNPDHWEPASGYAAAGVVADAQKLEAMVLRADGPRIPAVYVARAPQPGSATQTIIGAGTHLYGRLSDRIRRTAVLGNEYSSEVQTIDSITIEEEV